MAPPGRPVPRAGRPASRRRAGYRLHWLRRWRRKAMRERDMAGIRTVGIVGAGVIGSGWAARALAHGLDVVAWDPGSDAEAKTRATIANAWPALERSGLAPGASQDRLRFVETLAEIAQASDFIQENAPERE